MTIIMKNEYLNHNKDLILTKKSSKSNKTLRLKELEKNSYKIII